MTTGPSDTSDSNEAASTSTGASTEEEGEEDVVDEPVKPFANLSPGLSICEYFSLTLDYKETGTITSPDFPNHYGNHSQCSMLLSACPLCRINIKVLNSKFHVVYRTMLKYVHLVGTEIRTDKSPQQLTSLPRAINWSAIHFALL